MWKKFLILHEFYLNRHLNIWLNDTFIAKYIFSDFLCFASFLAHLGAESNDLNGNDQGPELQCLLKVKEDFSGCEI